MDALSQPIERVLEASEHFVRTPSVRVLHVLTSQLLRTPVLEHLCANEYYDFNTCPFFVLEGATEPGDDGWLVRCEELRGDWEALAAEAPEGAMAPLWPAQRAQAPVARFGLELGAALSLLRPPMTGLVIVLAPLVLRDAPQWRRDLGILLRERALSRARFILVELEEAASYPVLDELPAGSVERVDAKIDDRALAAEMDQRIDLMANAPPGATGPILAGAAGPRVAPPPRRRQATPMTPAQREERAKELGIPAAYLDPDVMQALRVLVMRAAQALRDGRAPEAVRYQREARDHCVAHGMPREAVVAELVLAGYVLQGGSPERALDVFRDAARRAETGQLGDLAVQAHMAIASCLLVLERVEDAAVAYAEAGKLGMASGATVLAIEAYRMCGQLLASRNRLEEAATAFRRALEAADRTPPEQRPATSAPDAARQLAALCRKHGLHQQADSLEAQAAALEEIPEPPPPAAAAASSPPGSPEQT